MMLEAFRQRIYPDELRIAAPSRSLSEALSAAAPLLNAPQPSAMSEKHGHERASQIDTKILAQIGTHLWRLRSKMIEPGSSVVRTEFSRAYRHFDAAWDALLDAGVEVLDPTGRPFDHGQALEALAFQPVPGLKRKTVIETLRPSILMLGKTIQTGDVIVGIPEEPTESGK